MIAARATAGLVAFLLIAGGACASGSGRSSTTQASPRGTAMGMDQLLARASRADFADYDPRTVIDAVNALQPLDKDKALDAIEAHLSRVDLDADPHEGLFLVLRVLFEVPPEPGYHPPPLLGGSMPAPPSDLRSLPLFPVVLIDDIPLMMVSGYELGGDAEPLSAHIGHFRATGHLRARPLEPKAPAGDLLDRFTALYQRAYGTAPSARELAFLQRQLDRLK